MLRQEMAMRKIKNTNNKNIGDAMNNLKEESLLDETKEPTSEELNGVESDIDSNEVENEREEILVDKEEKVEKKT